MDSKTIDTLIKLNRDFYDSAAQSFSATRKGTWPGWKRVIGHLSLERGLKAEVLDLACGNGRFGRCLLAERPDIPWDILGVDSCEPLMGSAGVQAGLPADDESHDGDVHCAESAGSRFLTCDILASLIGGERLSCLEGEYDLIACFGFMHHIPTQDMRILLLEEASRRLKPDGLMAVSFWRFADVPEMRVRAIRTTEAGIGVMDVQLEEGDFLLGWDGSVEHLRYCHSFDDGEIGEIIGFLGKRLQVVDRFESDGRNNALNTYVLFRVKQDSRL